MSGEKKTTYTYGNATIRLVSQYGEWDFEEIVSQVIVQKVLAELEQADS